MGNNGEFTLEEYLAAGEAFERYEKARQGLEKCLRGKLFIAGPIPVIFARRLVDECNKDGLRVGLACLLQAGLERNKAYAGIKISTTAYNALGLSPQRVYRGLKQLEAAGLAKVKRDPGRKARITLLLTAGGEEK